MSPDNDVYVRLADHRPTPCGFCLDERGSSEIFRNWKALKRHVVLVHLGFGAQRDNG